MIFAFLRYFSPVLSNDYQKLLPYEDHSPIV